MRPGISTLICVLLFVSAIAYAPTWALAVLAVMAVVAAVVDVALWRTARAEPVGQ